MTSEAAMRSVRNEATEIARGWSTPGAPPSWALTARIFTVVAHDEDLLALAAAIPAQRMPALLFAAAASYLIAEQEPPGLAGYFPTAGEPQPDLDPGFEPAFRAFCLDHRIELLVVCGVRRYQMNEVARSTQVALALGVVAHRNPAARIALVDLGTGAGFGLHPDRYGHQLGDGQRFGDNNSSLLLRCDATGPLPPPVPMKLPLIESRVGIDLDPIDLTDAEDRRWARACLPPESGAIARFDDAARIALDHPCLSVRGDAADVLPAILDAVPDDILPVVVDTYTAVFFADHQRSRLHQLLRRQAATRDLAWISLDPLIPLGTEGRRSVQDLDVPDVLVADYQQHGVFALLGLVWFERGRRRGDILARAHPSGTSMTWLDESSSAAGTANWGPR